MLCLDPQDVPGHLRPHIPAHGVIGALQKAGTEKGKEAAAQLYHQQGDGIGQYRPNVRGVKGGDDPGGDPRLQYQHQHIQYAHQQAVSKSVFLSAHVLNDVIHRLVVRHIYLENEQYDICLPPVFPDRQRGDPDLARPGDEMFICLKDIEALALDPQRDGHLGDRPRQDQVKRRGFIPLLVLQQHLLQRQAAARPLRAFDAVVR